MLNSTDIKNLLAIIDAAPIKGSDASTIVELKNKLVALDNLPAEEKRK